MIGGDATRVRRANTQLLAFPEHKRLAGDHFDTSLAAFLIYTLVVLLPGNLQPQ